MSLLGRVYIFTALAFGGGLQGRVFNVDLLLSKAEQILSGSSIMMEQYISDTDTSENEIESLLRSLEKQIVLLRKKSVHSERELRQLRKDLDVARKHIEALEKKDDVAQLVLKNLSVLEHNLREVRKPLPIKSSNNYGVAPYRPYRFNPDPYRAYRQCYDACSRVLDRCRNGCSQSNRGNPAGDLRCRNRCALADIQCVSSCEKRLWEIHNNIRENRVTPNRIRIAKTDRLSRNQGASVNSTLQKKPATIAKGYTQKIRELLVVNLTFQELALDMSLLEESKPAKEVRIAFQNSDERLIDLLKKHRVYPYDGSTKVSPIVERVWREQLRQGARELQNRKSPNR